MGAMSDTPAVAPDDLRSRLRPMRGRDPHEDGRAASTLELLFDLTFVVAVSTGASQLAEALASGHVAAGVGSFCFVSFGIIWAWINYSWFASAYDTDDWLYRLLTLVQMIGVVVFTLGIPDLFKGVEHGQLDNTVIVVGYVIMRLAMLCQWARAYRSDPERRSAIRVYIATLTVAQLLWIVTIWFKDAHWPLAVSFPLTAVLILLEMAGPFIAERTKGGTPWHAHHIVERHGLLTIITIGEIITGTVITLQHLKDAEGQSIDWSKAVLVALCGTALAFGLWWAYFIPRFAEVLHHNRGRSFGFSYAHFLVWPALAAVGGGLHVMALSFEESHGEHVDHLVAALALAVPIGVFMAGFFLAHYLTTFMWARLHTAIAAVTFLVLVVSVLLAAQGAGLTVVLALCTIVPWLVVAGFELSQGAEHEAQILNALRADEH